MRIEDFSSELIYQNDEGYSLGSISNDKRYLAFNKTITRDNSEMYLYDRNSGEMKHLSAHEGDINYFPVSFSHDNRVLYFLTDEGSEFTYLKKYDIASGATEVVEKTNWDIMYAISHATRPTASPASTTIPRPISRSTEPPAASR